MHIVSEFSHFFFFRFKRLATAEHQFIYNNTNTNKSNNNNKDKWHYITSQTVFKEVSYTQGCIDKKKYSNITYEILLQF